MAIAFRHFDSVHTDSQHTHTHLHVPHCGAMQMFTPRSWFVSSRKKVLFGSSNNIRLKVQIWMKCTVAVELVFIVIQFNGV